MNLSIQNMYPNDLCVDIDFSRYHYFQWLFEDGAYLQCSLFIASALQDLVLQRQTSRSTYSLLRRTIKLLNENLSSNDSAVSLRDSTVSVVVSLAMFSCIMSDQAGAKAHVYGLQKMITLRGGLKSFQHIPKLYMKLGR